MDAFTGVLTPGTLSSPRRVDKGQVGHKRSVILMHCQYTCLAINDLFTLFTHTNRFLHLARHWRSGMS